MVFGQKSKGIQMKKLLVCGIVFAGLVGSARAQIFSGEGIGGALLGALAGQAIGHDTESTLIGAGAGLAFGTLLGMDQRDRGYGYRRSHSYSSYPSYSYRSYRPYSSYRPRYYNNYRYSSYGHHHCPPPQVIRQVVPQPVVVQQPVMPMQYVPQQVVVQQPVYVNTAPPVMVLPQPVYVPQMMMAPRGIIRVTY